MILQYSLEVGICWAVFYLLFISFFKRETFFHINRSYLLVTLIIGLLLPLIKYYGLHLFTEETTMVATLQYISAGPQVFATSILTEGGTTFWSWRMLLIAIYVTGLAFTLSRVVIGLLRIRKLYINGTREKKHDHIIVHTFSNHLPFSFFNTIYLSGTLKFNKDINDILHHELTHVKRRHSLDVMFIELLGCLFWWNPIIYLYKREIKIIHEYVADAYALIGTSKSGYKQLISNQYSKHLEMTLANHFFNTNLKNRINMINQKSSSRHMKLKYLAIIPISVLLLIAFSGFMQKENADVTFYKSSDDILYTVLDNRTNEVISITTPSVVKYYEATGTDSPIIIVNGQRVDPPLKNHIVWNEKKCISYQPDATDEYGTAGKNGLIFISPNNLSSPEIESLSKIEEYEVGNALDASDHHTVHEFEYNANGKTTSVSLAEMPLIDFFGTTSKTYKKDLLSMEFTSIYERTIPHTNITACKKLFEALLKKYIIEYKGQKEIIKSDFHKIANLHGMRLSIAKDLQFTEFLFTVPHFSLMDYNQVRLSINEREAKNGTDYIIDTEAGTLKMLNLNESIEQ